MKSESLKSPFHVSQLSPTWKKCLRLVIPRFVSFTCHRCSFWSWWRRNCASVLTFKRRAMLFCILPALNFLACGSASQGFLHVTPSTVRSVSGLLPKGRWMAFTPSKLVIFHPALPDAACRTLKGRMLYQLGSPVRGTTNTAATSCCCSKGAGWVENTEKEENSTTV